MAQKLIRSDLYVADSDFMAAPNVWVRAGNTVVAGHPILKGREHKFRPFAPTFDLPIAPQPDSGELTGLAKHQALVTDALALGIPGKGTNAELQAAIDAKLAEAGS